MAIPKFNISQGEYQKKPEESIDEYNVRVQNLKQESNVNPEYIKAVGEELNRPAAPRAAELPPPPTSIDASLIPSETSSPSKSSADIRKDIEGRAQQRLEAYNRIFADMISERKKREQEQLAQARGVAVRSGLAGSSFVGQQQEPIKQAAEQDIQNIAARQAVAIQDLQKGIESDIRAEEKLALEGKQISQQDILFNQQQLDRAQGKIQTSIAQSAQSQIPVEQFMSSKLANDARRLGFSDEQLKGAYLGALPKSDIVGAPIKAGSKVIYFLKDSKGNITQQVLDTGVNLEDPKSNKQVIKDESGIYVVDLETNKVEKAFTLTPKASPLKGAPMDVATAIMQPNSGLNLDDVPIADRAAVGAELNKRKAEAIKSGDIFGVIKASAGGKPVSDTFTQSFEKAVNVVGQIGELKNSIDKETTGPIIGIIRSVNPYDVKAQKIKAQLSAIVPNLARGIYGEVGVLTDNDIELYSRTLPNLKSVEELRNAILGITLRSVQRSLENKVKTQAGLGRDVSGIASFYSEIKQQADSILTGIETSDVQSGSLKSQLEKDEILVKDKKSGQTGAISANEFDPNLYERID